MRLPATFHTFSAHMIINLVKNNGTMQSFAYAMLQLVLELQR